MKMDENHLKSTHLYPVILEGEKSSDKRRPSSSSSPSAANAQSRNLLEFEKNWTLKSIARVERKLNEPASLSSSPRSSLKGLHLEEIAASLEMAGRSELLSSSETSFATKSHRPSLFSNHPKNDAATGRTGTSTRIKIESVSSEILFDDKIITTDMEEPGNEIETMSTTGVAMKYSGSSSSSKCLAGPEYLESTVEMVGWLWKKSLLGWKNVKVIAKSQKSKPGLLCLMREELVITISQQRMLYIISNHNIPNHFPYRILFHTKSST